MKSRVSRAMQADNLFTTALAADCALEPQDAMAAVDLDAAALPDHLAVRRGYVGPVFPARDPVGVALRLA